MTEREFSIKPGDMVSTSQKCDNHEDFNNFVQQWKFYVAFLGSSYYLAWNKFSDSVREC